VRSDVLRVLARASLLLAVAPSLPSDPWPGARTLPDSVLRRLPRAIMPAQVTVRPASGTRMIAIPVDGGRPVPPRRPASPAGPVIAAAPWGEPLVPFAGVTVSTCLVPQEWLRSGTRTAEVIEVSRARAVPMMSPLLLTPPLSVSPPARQATITQFPHLPRPWPGTVAVVGAQRRPHGRFRRTATLAVGLLISLVVLQAAARTTRR
jgi:hypothetical protein